MSILSLEIIPSIFDHADVKELGVDGFKIGKTISFTYLYLAVFHDKVLTLAQ